MTVENALSKCFQKIIKFQLEPVWHQVSHLHTQFIIRKYTQMLSLLTA